MEQTDKSTEPQELLTKVGRKRRNKVYPKWSHPKNPELRQRLVSLMQEKDITPRDLGLRKDLWYKYSWGIFKTPNILKIKIADALMVDSREIWSDEEEA